MIENPSSKRRALYWIALALSVLTAVIVFRVFFTNKPAPQRPSAAAVPATVSEARGLPETEAGTVKNAVAACDSARERQSEYGGGRIDRHCRRRC